MRQKLILCLGIIMIMSTIPIVQAGEEANEYTTIVLTENKVYMVGDTVTLDIRFYQKDTLVDPDDINVTVGWPESGTGRYVEVNEGDIRISTGIYRVTFTYEEGDDLDMGSLIGEVRCTISTGKDEVSDTDSYLCAIDAPRLIVRITADKARFGSGDTVRFTVTFRYNGSFVDPDNIYPTRYVNGEKKSISLTRDSEGVYYYDYNSTEDTESKNVKLEVNVDHQGVWSGGEGYANLDYFQVWFDALGINLSALKGTVGICDMEGNPVEVAIDLIYRYMNESWEERVKTITGTTDANGLLEVTLDYPDIAQDEWVDITIWANDTMSRADEYHQWSNENYDLPWIPEPWEKFEVFFQGPSTNLPPGDEVTLDYRAYYDGTPLGGKNIYYFLTTDMSFLDNMGLESDGEMGEVLLKGVETSDTNGFFSVTLTTPENFTMFTDQFKANFSGGRGGEGDWEAVMPMSMFMVGSFVPFDQEINIDVNAFGVGEEGDFTVTRTGQDGEWGSLMIFPVNPSATEDDIMAGMYREDQFGWMSFNFGELDPEIPFTGESYYIQRGIPGFLSEDDNYLIVAGIFVDDDSIMGDLTIGYTLVDSNGDPIAPKDMIITTSLPDTVKSEQRLQIFINVTGGSRIEGVEVKLATSGPGRTCKNNDTTDENGQVECHLTLDNVTGENVEITIWINGTKDGYIDFSYQKVITIIAWNPPEPDKVLEPIVVDLGNGTSAEVIAGVQGNVTLNVQSATQPDTGDPHALGVYLDVTSSGTGTLNWVNITISYDTIPPGIDPANLKMYYWNDAQGEWVLIVTSGVDTVNKIVWANITHLTIFAPRETQGDVIPPAINHNVVTKGTEGEKITITAKVTDDGNGVRDVDLYYRKVGISPYKKLAMTKSGDDYSADIPGLDIYIEGVEYYIKATDGDNSATDPSNINPPHFITIEAKPDDGDDDDDDDSFIPGFELMLVLVSMIGVSMLLRKKKR